jgi:hypothetical protein
MAALAQIAQQALQDLLGNQQAGEQMQPNMSGKAVELIQQRLDMQVFIYMSNLAKAMKRCGEVWLSMKKELTVEDSRRMKTVDPEGKPSSVVMNERAYNEEKGEDYLANDLTKANFEVDVDVGPSSSSKRAATVRALTALKQSTTDPETSAILDSLILMNMEGEGMGDTRDFFRAKLVRMGVVKPTEEEAQQMQSEAANQQPDAQTQYLEAAAEEAQSNAAQSRAKTVQTIADAHLKDAQRIKTLADAAAGAHAQQLDGARFLQEVMNPPAPPGGA